MDANSGEPGRKWTLLSLRARWISAGHSPRLRAFCAGDEGPGTTEREGAWTGRALRHARPGGSLCGVRIRHILRMTPRRP